MPWIIQFIVTLWSASYAVVCLYASVCILFSIGSIMYSLGLSCKTFSMTKTCTPYIPLNLNLLMQLVHTKHVFNWTKFLLKVCKVDSFRSKYALQRVCLVSETNSGCRNKWSLDFFCYDYHVHARFSPYLIWVFAVWNCSFREDQFGAGFRTTETSWYLWLGNLHDAKL